MFSTASMPSTQLPAENNASSTRQYTPGSNLNTPPRVQRVTSRITQDAPRKPSRRGSSRPSSRAGSPSPTTRRGVLASQLHVSLISDYLCEISDDEEVEIPGSRFIDKLLRGRKLERLVSAILHFLDPNVRLLIFSF